jgi:xylulokinase
MHGLVAVDKDGNPVRESIIWCDSRAVEIGDLAFNELGAEFCLGHCLNSPGNFTASKLKWVKENEPDIYNKIYKIMLPGDYIAYRLTGEIKTTVSGLSEGILWDFKENTLAKPLLDLYGIDKTLLPEITDTFSDQGNITKNVAEELGLSERTVVAYRAGDQPNNALSLNVFEPGEVAATAGTSGVVYGISEEVTYDPFSRVNTFAHVNHTREKNRLGILLCINGTGILNSWVQKNITQGLTYEEMNQLAERSPAGSDGLLIFPFGNGAERILNNKNPGGQFYNLNFNRHNQSHILRAAQEGIVFSFFYGLKIMEEMSIKPKVIRAGNANMFLSKLFRQTLADLTQTPVELYNTDGAKGAALASGIGIGYYKSTKEAFTGLEKTGTIDPEKGKHQEYLKIYNTWEKELEKQISNK